MALSGLKATVIGGGIGGMAAALALARRGASVSVCEQAPAFEDVGAGLQISANGQRVLQALGAVGAEPPRGATVATGTRVRDAARGRSVAFIPGPRAGPTWYLHRADLLDVLVSAARRAGVALHLNSPVTPGTEPGADLIVAADGARSAWRAVIDGRVAPRFSGQVAWRALVPWDPARTLSEATLTLGPGAHAVNYTLRGGRVMNLVAVEERQDWTEEGWRLRGDADLFRARFSGFGGPLREIVAGVSEVTIWALHLRPVARRWQDGRAVLLGDAAHPTLPFMAQGACLALEDAWVLAAALAAAPDVPAGLLRYETLRRARAERIVGLARGNAWRFHLRKPLAYGVQATMALGARALARRLDWIYDYDATTAVSEIELDPDRHVI